MGPKREDRGRLQSRYLGAEDLHRAERAAFGLELRDEEAFLVLHLGHLLAVDGLDLDVERAGERIEPEEAVERLAISFAPDVVLALAQARDDAPADADLLSRAEERAVVRELAPQHVD